MNRQPSGFPGCESPGAAALPGGSRPGVSAARNGSQQLPPARCPGSPSILGPADSQGRRPVPGARDPCFYPETVPCVSGRLPRQADFSSPPEPPRLGCFPCRLVSFARLQEDSVWVGPGQADRTIPTAIKLDLGKVGPGPLVLQCGLCGFHQLLRGLRDTALPSGCWRFVEVDGGGGGGGNGTTEVPPVAGKDLGCCSQTLPYPTCGAPPLHPTPGDLSAGEGLDRMAPGCRDTCQPASSSSSGAGSQVPGTRWAWPFRVGCQAAAHSVFWRGPWFGRDRELNDSLEVER